MTWDEIFDPAEFYVPPLLLDLGVVDISYKNDNCPCFSIGVTPRTALRIWVQHNDPQFRHDDNSGKFEIWLAGLDDDGDFADNDAVLILSTNDELALLILVGGFSDTAQRLYERGKG